MTQWNVNVNQVFNTVGCRTVFYNMTSKNNDLRYKDGSTVILSICCVELRLFYEEVIKILTD